MVEYHLRHGSDLEEKYDWRGIEVVITRRS